MEHIKKFENYHDAEYDYTNSQKPITPEMVKETIMSELKKWEVDNPNLESDVDMLTKRIMFGFSETLSYMSENYESELEQIALGEYI